MDKLQLCAIIKSFADLLNAGFTIAFIGGLTGAIGGALGAQYIAERMKRRENLIKEIRSTNAAIITCFSICNAGIVTKDQHIGPMWEEFQIQQKRMETFKRDVSAGKIPNVTESQFRADLRGFPAPIVPMDTLKNLMFERISVYGRSLALTSALEQSLINLTRMIDMRNQLIEQFKSGAIPQELQPNFYFGLPLEKGKVNQQYPDTMGAIFEYTNDLIFYSATLCDDLMQHGNKVRLSLGKSKDSTIPKISEVDFSTAKQNGLIPTEENYKRWLSAFQESD